MAEIEGVSVQRLKKGFGEYVATMPFAYLCYLRLEWAQAELRGAGEATIAADVAAMRGFADMGCFPAAYRAGV